MLLVVKEHFAAWLWAMACAILANSGKHVQLWSARIAVSA